MKCIICMLEKEENEFNEEHIFPESIGGTLVINNVCTSCNSILGTKVDAYLVDHYLIQMNRLLYKLPGKSGKIPNPLRDGTLAADQNQIVKYNLDKDGNPSDVYLLPKLKEKLLSEGAKQISISIDKKDIDKLPDIINKKIQRMGYDYRVKAEDLSKHLKENEIAHPEIHVEGTIDLINYQRAVLKIVYELAVYWLGNDYLDDIGAAQLRAVLRDNSDPQTWSTTHKIHGTINFVSEKPSFPFWDDKPSSHIAFLHADGNTLSCYVRIFNVIQGTVLVSTNAMKYQQLTDHFIEIESTTGHIRESGLLSEFARLSKSRNH